MNMTPKQLEHILEAALMVYGGPLSPADLHKLFTEADAIELKDVKAALLALQEKYAESGLELQEVASGFQIQAKKTMSGWLNKLWEERPARYSRAFLETLALIAYRQPITRAEVEEIRGVSASSHIMKTLTEREWIRIIGYKEVPGKPALYGTTKEFLDHFNLKNLSELPALLELTDIDAQAAKLQVQLELAPAPSVTTITEDIDIPNE